jgi:hypothetical protein
MDPFPSDGMELTRLLVVTGGPPTEDKPTVTFAPPADADTVSAEMIFGVPDRGAAYETPSVSRRRVPARARRQR